MLIRYAMVDIDYWKRIILKLPDAAFFDIVRNYLGEFKTPFNKHALIEDLIAFLNRPATRERIVLCLSEDDAKLLTAIEVLNNPTEEDLSAFFDGEKSYLELHHHILNLEERLIVFLDVEHEKPELHINPLFADLIHQAAYNPGILFPSIEIKHEGEINPPWLSEPLITAFLSFILKRLKVLKADGQIKKKIEDEMLQILPGLIKDTRQGTRFSLLMRGLVNLKLIEAQDALIKPDMDRWRAFALLPKEDGLLYIIAAACIQDVSSIKSIQETACIIRGLLSALPSGRAFTLQALVRLASVSDRGKALPQRRYEYLIDTLADFEILIPTGDWGFCIHPYLSFIGGTGVQNQSTSSFEPPLILQPNFTITVKPWLSLSDSILIACIADITRYDTYPQYTISRHSFIRIFDYGITAAEVLSRLKELSGQDIPQNVAFSVMSWANDYGSLKFYKGIICVADKEKTHIIEHTDILTPWIKKTFAPGLYLFDPDEREEWENAFRKVGIDPVPGIEAIKQGENDLFPSSDFPELNHEGLAVQLVLDEPPPVLGAANNTPMTKELYERLDELSLPREAAEEIRARIQKHLILFPEQINPGLARQEKTEAKGIDYVGKVRLIEQAIASKRELLEVIERTAKGSPRRILMKPEETKKTENDLILIGKSLPAEEEVRIFVRKASLIRKLKTSLFAP